ncbi:MAG: hypothetical protein QW594_03595 [Candidatus Woesearchaeota archaeon]
MMAMEPDKSARKDIEPKIEIVPSFDLELRLTIKTLEKKEIGGKTYLVNEITLDNNLLGEKDFENAALVYGFLFPQELKDKFFVSFNSDSIGNDWINQEYGEGLLVFFSPPKGKKTLAYHFLDAALIVSSPVKGMFFSLIPNHKLGDPDDTDSKYLTLDYNFHINSNPNSTYTIPYDFLTSGSAEIIINRYGVDKKTHGEKATSNEEKKVQEEVKKAEEVLDEATNPEPDKEVEEEEEKLKAQGEELKKKIETMAEDLKKDDSDKQPYKAKKDLDSDLDLLEEEIHSFVKKWNELLKKEGKYKDYVVGVSSKLKEIYVNANPKASYSYSASYTQLDNNTSTLLNHLLSTYGSIIKDIQNLNGDKAKSLEELFNKIKLLHETKGKDSKALTLEQKIRSLLELLRDILVILDDIILILTSLEQKEEVATADKEKLSKEIIVGGDKPKHPGGTGVKVSPEKIPIVQQNVRGDTPRKPNWR